MKGLLFLILGATITTNAVAGGCDWATETPADDGKYKYFVAKSYSESSASDAANKAEQDIDAQLGRLFGTKLDIQSEYYSDETGASGTMRSYERALGAITLKGLERQKSDVVKESKAWVGCVQYRYLKSEINKEKERLKSLSPSAMQKSLVFTEVAGDTECHGSPVEIVTVPSGAYVTIDNGRYHGSAPIKFGNVCHGKHTLEITHDNYEFVSEKLIVPVSGRIEKTLKRATKKITVKTSLGNSQIEINGVNKGKEPVTFSAPLGIEQSITAVNKEAEKVTRNRAFSKDSDSEYVINMEKLPGQIDFTAFKVRNPGVDIFVDGKKVIGNSSLELSAEKRHNIKFTKKDFIDITKKQSVEGGKTLYYPSKELTFSKTPDVSGGILLGMGYSWGDNKGYNFDLGFDLQSKYLFGGVGLQLNYLETPKLEMQYLHSRMVTDGYELPYYTQTVVTNTEYIEFLYGNLGVKLGKYLAVFGALSVGTLKLDQLAASYSSVSMSQTTPLSVRYGYGIQLMWPNQKNGGFGIRATYLTGDINLDASDIDIESNTTYGAIKDKRLISYPEKITNWNVTFFYRFSSVDSLK